MRKRGRASSIWFRLLQRYAPNLSDMHTPVFSLEVFPPKRNGPIGTIYDTLDGLQGLRPDFISVTYGHGSQSDRTATARIAHTIIDEYHIPTVAHLTALYADTQLIDNTLEQFEQAGVTAVLALRGDPVEDMTPLHVFTHASDLIAYIKTRKPELTIFGACYPEGHSQSASLADDIDHLKEKVDAGATHLISQLFYDNEDFYRFLDKARSAGVSVPIEAGIMPVISARSVTNMAMRTGSRIPAELGRLLDRWQHDDNTLRDAGITYASQQIADLVASGVDGIHLYTMNRPATTRRIWRNVASLFEDDHRTLGDHID